MRVRSKRASSEGGGGIYYSAPLGLEYVKSGSTLLDLCATNSVAGCWPLGRVSNVIGDKSTGKTLVAIEACANFYKQYPKGHIWYRETESAFDTSYAASIGMPVEHINKGEKKWTKFDTVEDVFDDLSEKIAATKKAGVPCLYIVDSLDALSDKAELKRKIEDRDYPRKPALLSQLFRRKIREIEESQTHLMIISQIRTNIGAMFGDKTSRTGGRALDFYSSLVFKLAHIGQLSRTIKGEKRVTGVRIKAKCTKNKIGPAFRECEFILRFSYGIENYESSMEWLLARGGAKLLGISAAAADTLVDDSAEWDPETYSAREAELVEAVAETWMQIEKEFRPTRPKYG